VIYIFIYLFLEVMISTSIAGSIGGFMTFMEIIVTAFIGIFILKNFKYSLASNMSDLMKGEITQQDFIKQNVANALGAILLIVPGFFTDILGVLLQFGILTFMLQKIFKFKPTQCENGCYSDKFNKTNKGEYDEEIIDVEVIEHTTNK